MSDETFELRPIGHVRGGRGEAVDDHWGPVRARIDLDGGVLEPDATAGLDRFSHVEVVFVFHGVDESSVCVGSRHPRGNDAWPRVGILAQRAKDRPNRIGLTTCAVVAVGDGWIDVAGLDAIDGTPVLDVKPYVRELAPRSETRQPAWITELMREYW